jgi:hypothetical protein
MRSTPTSSPLTPDQRTSRRRDLPIGLTRRGSRAIHAHDAELNFVKDVRDVVPIIFWLRVSRRANRCLRRCRVLAESRRSCPRRTTFLRFAAKGLSRISFALAVADHVLTAVRPPNSIAAKQFETCPDMIGVAQPAAPASGVLDHAKRRSVGVAVGRRAELPRGWTASGMDSECCDGGRHQSQR